MTKFITLLVILFSYVIFDLNLFRRKIKYYSVIEEQNDVFSDRRKNVYRKKKYNNKKHKRRTFYKRKQFKIKGSNPKSNRFSNQRMLRRMYRNM